MARRTSRSRGGGVRALDARELESAAGFWLRLAQQRDLKAFNTAVEGSGISQPLYAMLILIDANPGCRQADIGQELRMRQPNLVEPIEALIGRGLVQRSPDPSDRRAQVLSLTAEGESLLGRLRRAHRAVIAQGRRRLGPEGYEQLIRLLRRLAGGGAEDGSP